MDYIEANEIEFFKDMDLSHSLDFLTSVLNREVTDAYINHLISNNIPFTAALLDVDNFKTVNDTYGHMKGDEVIIEFSKKLKEVLRGIGVVCRYGGDEFLFIIENISKYEDVWNLFHKININTSLTELNCLPKMKISFTIGIARYPIDCENNSVKELFEKMDKALYRGKVKGRSCFIIYSKEKHENIEIKSIRDQMISLTDLFFKTYEYLENSSNDINTAIDDLFSFLSNTLMFEHLCIQHNGNIKFEKIHLLSKNRDFDPIDDDLIYETMNSQGLFIINRLEDLQLVKRKELYEQFKTQHVKSSICVKICAYNKEYGFIRVDHESNRIWQENVINLLVVAAKTIGLVLYNTNSTL